MTKAAKRLCLVLALTTFYSLIPSAICEASVSNSDAYRILYRAERGDSLTSVAGRFGLDSDLVAAMNNLDPYARLTIGQRIYLPKEPETEYRLKSGDNLWSLSRKHGINVQMLMAYNGITRPEQLQIGQVIRIPAEGESEETVVPVLAMARTSLSSRGLGALFLPVVGTISSQFGWRKSGFHHGTDIAAKTGTPIKAAEAGTISFAGWRSIYGQMVIIDHGNEIQTVYGHTSKILVHEGQQVIQGQVIAKVGSTGRATGPHLHFEVRVKEQVVDPFRYLQKI